MHDIYVLVEMSFRLGVADCGKLPGMCMGRQIGIWESRMSLQPLLVINFKKGLFDH